MGARVQARSDPSDGPIEQLPAALWSILEDFPNYRLLLVVLRQAVRLSLLEPVAYRDRGGLVTFAERRTYRAAAAGDPRPDGAGRARERTITMHETRA
jgi:hypothetical protein